MALRSTPHPDSNGRPIIPAQTAGFEAIEGSPAGNANANNNVIPAGTTEIQSPGRLSAAYVVPRLCTNAIKLADNALYLL